MALMLGRVDANASLDVLSSAIAALGEACVERAACAPDLYEQAATDLAQLGADIAALAQAMAVIVRRTAA